jgi:hypothetical protein
MQSYTSSKMSTPYEKTPGSVIIVNDSGTGLPKGTKDLHDNAQSPAYIEYERTWKSYLWSSEFSQVAEAEIDYLPVQPSTSRKMRLASSLSLT